MALVHCNLALCVPRTSYMIENTSATHDTLLVQSEIPKTSGENFVLIRVDRFGFSSNNITYQALGEVPHFRYFDFHDVPETDKTSRKSHGLIPVWGFGTVVWTSHKRIEVGERVYGYFAPIRYLLLPISTSDVNKYSFFVSRPHFPRDRRPYNQITRCRADPQYNPSPEIEDLTMLYRPLFWTSFWCEDWLAASRFRGGANNFVISSASSKTAFCLAYLIRERFKRLSQLPTLNVIGLTSKKNVAFTRTLGLYGHVIEYDDIQTRLEVMTSGNENGKWIYVDVAGNEALNEKIRSLFLSADDFSLVAHISLGLTNLSPTASSASSTSWSENTQLLDVTQSTEPVIDHSRSETSSQRLPNPESFFMPEWLAVRRTQLSVPQITAMQADAWTALLRDGRSWVRMERVYGGLQVKEAYARAIRDGLGPEKGYIWSMWEEGDREKVFNAKL